MKLYRFSPILNEQTLTEAVSYMHTEAHRLCVSKIGRYLPVAGNIGIFCHYQDEYDQLSALRKELTKASENWNQKYFALHEPYVYNRTDTTPAATYEYLYVRKPDPYRYYVGDIDFSLNDEEYEVLKREVQEKDEYGVRIFPEDRLDMIELFDPDSDVICYISNTYMTDLVKTQKSSHSPS